MLYQPIAGVSLDLTQPAPAARPPDFDHCDAFYGQNLNTVECYNAAERLPQGNSVRGYGVALRQYNPAPYYVLPFSIQEGGCYISVEAAGPVVPPVFEITPDDVRSRAASVIQGCVINHQGIGGFATHQFENMFGFIMAPTYVPGSTPIPATTAFLTITVSGPEAKLSTPGNKDTQFAVELAGIFEDKSYQYEDQGNMELAFKNVELARDYLTSAANMAEHGQSRGSPSWWLPEVTPPTQNTLPESDVNYECDAYLGSPSPTDCTSLQSHDLGPDSDTLQIHPGDVTFLHQNSCTTAITSSIPLVLTWEQIRVALTALITTCVLHPSSKGPHGGRAFYEPHPVRRRHGGGKRLGRRGRDLLNALPPHVNITLFGQEEPWLGDGVEQKSCTWKAVVNGVSVASCSGA